MAGDYILIVDDSREAQSLFRMVLTSAGYQTVVVSSGQEALERISQDVPALMVLDLMMPDMSGFEVLKRLRAQLADGGMPVIIVSAYLSGEEGNFSEAGFLKLPGVTRMISKNNFQSGALIACVEDLLGQKKPG